MPDSRKIIPVLITGILVSILTGCGRNPVNRNGKDFIPTPASTSRTQVTRIVQPETDQVFTVGEVITALVAETGDSVHPIDSIESFFGSARTSTRYSSPYRFDFQTIDQPVGTLPIRIIVWMADSLREYHNLQVILHSDLVPQVLPYRIEHIYPHDIKAYTQGLVYEEGYLYEGTGQYNESSLRKVEISTGEPIRLTLLACDIFGEGITIFH